MNDLTKAIIASLKNRSILDTKLNDSGLLSITLKGGDKIVFSINLSKGIDYVSFKETKPVTKIEKITKQSEKMLSTESPVKKVKKKKISRLPSNNEDDNE